MNPKSIIVLVVGLAIAGGTGFMMYKFLNAKQAEIKKDVTAERQKVPPQIPTVKVLVAKSDLVVGTRIGRENLHWQVWPQESVSPSYVVEGSKLVDAGKSDEKKWTLDDFLGSVVRLPIAAGQPVTVGMVAQKGERGFLAAVLQPGMRAMSLPVNVITGISGFILPGDRVDIMWDVKKSNRGPFTQTLMQNIRVLAVDQKTQASGASPAKTLTLELTPKQVEALSLASNLGSLEFVLRSIAPDEEEREQQQGAEDGLLQVSMSDGTQGGALIGADILAVSEKDKEEEVTRDSWTLPPELMYGGKPKKKKIAVAPQPRLQGTGTGRGTGGGSVAGGGSRSSRITIVRGTQAQAIKLKK